MLYEADIVKEKFNSANFVVCAGIKKQTYGRLQHDEYIYLSEFTVRY